MGWIVYKHTNKTNGKVYIGITSQSAEKRWDSGWGYCSQPIFWAAIQKYGWQGFTHEVLFSELTEEEAKQKEIELIAEYKSNAARYFNPSFGYNASDGGEGRTGYKWTDAMREARECKKVCQYDLTGNFIKTHASAGAAQEETGIKHDNIRYCCEGVSKRAGDFMWVYLEKEPAPYIEDYWSKTGFQNPYELEQQKLDRQEKLLQQKKIIQFNKFGEEIGRWDSIKEAADYLDLYESVICNALRGKKPRAGGYMWKYADEEKAKNFPIFYELIEQYTKDGHLLHTYTSATEASQETGVNNSHICAVCKGKRKTAGGYVWKKITKQL